MAKHRSEIPLIMQVLDTDVSQDSTALFTSLINWICAGSDHTNRAELMPEALYTIIKKKTWPNTAVYMSVSCCVDRSILHCLQSSTNSETNTLHFLELLLSYCVLPTLIPGLQGLKGDQKYCCCGEIFVRQEHNF